MIVAQVLSGAGAAVYPLMAQAFVEEFGFRGAHALLTAISLNAVLAMAVLRPVPIKRTRSPAMTASDLTSKDTLTKGAKVEGNNTELLNLHNQGTRNRLETGEMYMQLHQKKADVDEGTLKQVEKRPVDDSAVLFEVNNMELITDGFVCQLDVITLISSNHACVL